MAGESLGVVGGAVTVMIALATAFYRLGTNHGAARRVDEKVGEYDAGRTPDAEFKGAQVVRNEAAARVERRVEEIAGDVIRIGTRQENHDHEDNRRFAEQATRFDRIDANVERLQELLRTTASNLSAQISNVALGRAGRFEQVKTMDD